MSDSYPVVKGKRPKALSKANKSFVSNVKSRVSGLLPTTITKWFSPSSSANGSATLADETDSSTEDEATESPITTQPAAKRMRFSSPARNANTHYTPINTRTSSTNTDAVEPFISTPSTSDIMFRRSLVSPHAPKNDESTVLAIDSKVNNFDLYSTPEVPLERKRKSIFDKTQDSDAIIEDAVARSASAKVVNLTQPYFKAGLLCSPFYSGRTSYGGASSSYINQPNINQRRKTVVNETNTTDNVLSHSARHIMDILENYSSPLKEAKRIPPYSSPNTSFSLQTLDSSSKTKNTSYKTQELHVPQIASIIRLKQKRLMDTTNAARQIIASLSSSTPYPQSLPSQNVAEKEKLTTKIKSRLTRTNREPIQNSMAPLPVNLPTVSLQIEKDKLPTFSFNTSSSTTLTSSSAISTTIAPKIQETPISSIDKTKDVTPSLLGQKTTLSQERKNPTENNLISQFKFSSPVKVSIEQSTGSTTTFSFGSPERNLDSARSSTGFTFSQTESQPKTVDNTKSDTLNMKNKECSCSGEFGNKNKCAVCEKKSNSIEKLPISKVSDKWKCADCWVENDSNSVACVCCGAKKSKETPKQSKASDSAKATDSVKASDKWKCVDCWVQNDSSSVACVCCGAKKSNEKPNQSKATDSAKATDSVKTTDSIKVTNSDKWKCKDCWVDNDNSASKCVCCGGAKVSTNKSETQKTQSLFTATKEISNNSDWKCDVCWIQNKSSTDKCAACSSPKPGSKSVAGGSTNLPLQNATQSQSDKWECSICLVRNENNRIKCVCCEAERPGAKKQPESKFSFKDNPGALFKFGIPAGTKQDTNAQIPTLAKETPAKESEANNNVLPKATFTFGIPKSNTETAKSTKESKKDEPTKPTFSFGITKPAPLSTSVEVSKPMFGIPKKPEVSETASTVSDKTVETPKIQPAIPVLTSTPSISIASNLFASPVSTPSENKTSTPSLSFLSTPATSAIAASSNVLPTSLSTATVTSTETKAPTSTFSFSAGTIKPNVNLFAAPTSISPVSTASSSFQSVVTAAVTTSISLFSKSEPVNASPISLFQKSDTTPVSLPAFGGNAPKTTTTVSQLSTTPSAPVFRFSNITNNAPSNNEKPKFNFTFGNNTSTNETPSMFKSFGATSESNKFTLPTSNTLGLNSISGNVIGGSGLSTGINSSNNTIPGINGLPTGNTILGSDIGSNQPNTGATLSSSSTTAAPATGLFGNPLPKVNNVWSANNNAPSTQTFEKPAATFTFGSSTQFNSNTSSTFGSAQQNPQPTQNLFGISNQTTNNSQPTLFSNTVQTPPQNNIFGSPGASTMPMFGSPSIGSTPTFGTSTSLPTFEAPSASSTPSFNFGSNATPAVFGFSQQQQPQQPQAAGVYNFGAGGAAPQVQFNMGSAPNTTAVRRVRKAVRRTQR